MIDKEYIKEIISRITKKKADGNIVPATASMQEIMIAVHEILKPFINGAGWLVGCGLKKVHTIEHGDFCIILFHNPPKDMIQKIHTFQEEE